MPPDIIDPGIAEIHPQAHLPTDELRERAPMPSKDRSAIAVALRLLGRGVKVVEYATLSIEVLEDIAPVPQHLDED